MNYNNEVIFYRIKVRINMYSKQKMESIKESAYFDYFKFFSMNAAETIRKLETTFKDEISEDVFFDANHMFKRVKTLLSSYEILLMEIKDSCEFVEIPEFGVCIMKIFFQLMSIIKFMGKSIILRSGIEKNGSEKEKRADQRHTMISTSPSEFYQRNIKPVSPQSQERENFRMKEMASHIFKDIRQEVADLQKQHKKDSLESDKAFQKISKGREKLQEIQSSQSQAVLAETVNMLCKKSEHINSFINIVQTNMTLQSKENNIDTYLKIKEQFDEDCAPRFENAKEKLSKIFKQHVLSYEKKKQSLMTHFECQVKIQDEECVQEKSKTSFHSNKKNHSTNDQIKKLKNQIRLIEDENKTLKTFIQQKCEQYQIIITKLRSQKISIQSKANLQNKSSIFQKYKSSSSKKSQSYIQNIENTDNISEAHSHMSVQSENKEFFHTFDGHNPGKRSKVNLSTNRMNRSKVKFNFNEKNIAIYSKLVNEVISNDPEGVIEGGKNEKISLQHKDSEFEQIEERPSEHECSFRDTSAQLSQTLLKNSKFKAKKDRTSLLLLNQLKQSKESLQYDSKSKKNFHPLCSIVAKKLMNRKEAEQNKEEMQSNEKLLTCKHVNSNHVLEKKNSKGNTSQAKLSIFHKLDKQSEKRYSNNHENIEQNHVQTLPQQPKRLKNPKLMEGVEVLDFQFPISFEKNDLSNLFLTQDNAHNYQILNINLLSKNSNYFSILRNKNIVIKDVPKSSNNSRNNSYKNLSPKYQQKEQPVSIGDILIGVFYKYLKFLRQGRKQSQKNYHIIKNFIRFPYSSVYRRGQNEWKQYQTQNNVIEFLELKKYVARIIKLHFNCKHISPSFQSSHLDNETSSDAINQSQSIFLCDHWRSFMSKIGLNLTQINE